jgi:gluconokinase
MGTAGAGKTRVGEALAAALSVRFIEGDGFHPPENVTQMAAGIPLTDENRHGWLLALAAQLQNARERDEGIVMTCSALKRRYRDMLRGGDDSIRFIVLQGDAVLLRRRLLARSGHYMPASLLDSQLASLELPTADERAWLFDVQQSPDELVDAILAQLRAASDSHAA